MKFIDYINLGFEKIELEIDDDYKRTGHKNFKLTKQIRNNITLEASSNKLNEPEMVLPFESDGRTQYNIKITTLDVKHLVNNDRSITWHENQRNKNKPESH